jgi:4-amino-4-deoxy-L-arabinose transferase
MKKVTIVIFTLFFLLYILPLGVRPMVIPDETRYAEISREMLDTGEWIVPKLDSLRYFEKPVLGYWLNAAAEYLFGENAFASRLSSALAVGFSALVIFLLVRRFADGALSGILAAAIFLTCLEVFAVGVFCVLDSVFSLFVTATIVSFYFGWEETRHGGACRSRRVSRKKTAFLILSGIFCGLAFLTKGFLAFMLPALVIIPFAFWERRFRKLLALCCVPLATAILVALPWCLAIHLRESDFWHYFFWEEHIKRFFKDTAQHANPFWFFIPMIAGGALPWTPLLPIVIAGFKKTQLKDSFLRFLLCWLVFPFLFFSFCRGKIGTYILPCYPPLAILIMIGLVKYLAAGRILPFRRSLIGSATLLIIIIAAFILIQTVLPDFRIYDQKETWKWIMLTFGLLFYALFLLLAAKEANYWRKLILCCIAPGFVMFASHFIIPDRLKSGKMPGQFLMGHSDRISSFDIIVSDNSLTPAVCWLFKRDDIYLVGRSGEFEYGLSYNGLKHRKIDPAEFRDFIERNSKWEKIILITSVKHYDDYKKMLPNPSYEESSCDFVFVEYEPSVPKKHILLDL